MPENTTSKDSVPSPELGRRESKRIRREEATVTEFGAHLEPMLRVEPGETFRAETRDAFSAKYPNPVAGPIYVEGLEAGDLLVLEIKDVIPGEQGRTGFFPP